MAKRIRFPLEMDNEIQVRSIEELKENFSLIRVLKYLEEGKLVIWLRDRYENNIADHIEKLNLNDEELAKRVCEIFDVSYVKALEDVEEAEKEQERVDERTRRIQKLKEYVDDKEYEEVIDSVAFDQDELYDLLDEDVTIIYLCGKKFSIPLAKEGVTYIGINQPTVVIDSKVEVNWVEKNISIKNVVFDRKYQNVLDSASEMDDNMKMSIDEKINALVKESLANDLSLSSNDFLNYLLSRRK